jgi:hypothetical protein
MRSKLNHADPVPIRKSLIKLEVGQVWQALEIDPSGWSLEARLSEDHCLQPLDKFIIAESPADPIWYMDSDQVEITLVDGQRSKLPRWAFERDRLFRLID